MAVTKGEPRNSPNSAEDFILQDANITSNRFSKTIAINNIIAEINIYESMFSQFLTGSMLIMDDSGLVNTIDLQGTETIELSFKIPGPNTTLISKKFVITSVEKSYKQNDSTTILLLTIIEDIGYYNNVMQISKSYTGRGEDIIRNILKDNLSKDLATKTDLSFEPFKQSFQDTFRYIVPYTTPLDAVRTVLRKMSSERGSPYFCYSTLLSKNQILADLETILERPAINATKPFRFNQSQTNANLKATPYSIYSYDTTSSDDTLLLAQLGAVGSLHSALNVSTGEKTLEHIDVNEVFRQLKQVNVLENKDKIMLDNQFVADPSGIDPRLLGEHNSRYFHQIAGSTYPLTPNVRNWTEEKDIYSYKIRIQKFAIEHFLQKNVISLTIPGLLFISGSYRLDVGNQIEVAVNKSEIPSSDNNLSDVVDKKKSGSFIILTKRHVFKTIDQSHIVSIECARLAERVLQ